MDGSDLTSAASTPPPSHQQSSTTSGVKKLPASSTTFSSTAAAPAAGPGNVISCLSSSAADRRLVRRELMTWAKKIPLVVGELNCNLNFRPPSNPHKHIHGHTPTPAHSHKRTLHVVACTELLKLCRRVAMALLLHAMMMIKLDHNMDELRRQITNSFDYCFSGS
jgi:hypothetical protein